MAVVRKPKNVEEFIKKGGSVPQAGAPVVPTVVEEPPPTSQKEKEKEQALKLRLPMGLLQQVDEAVAGRRPAPSRHQWILEAIYEKLDREGAGDQ